MDEIITSEYIYGYNQAIKDIREFLKTCTEKYRCLVGMFKRDSESIVIQSAMIKFCENLEKEIEKWEK